MNLFECNHSSKSLMPLFLLTFLLLSVMCSTLESLEKEEKLTDPTSVVIIQNNEKSKFKNIQEPSNGTVRLIKGKCKVIHHSIKEDSVIMLSRKSLEGKTGFHLVVDIEPNEFFIIKSMSDEDDNYVVEDEDCGEVYFNIH